MKKWFRRIIMALLLAVFVFSAATVLSVQKQYRESEKLYNEATEQFVKPVSIPPSSPAPARIKDTFNAEDDSKAAAMAEEASREYAPFSVDFDGLKQRGPDVIGWLYCPDTVIDYPVVKATNNDYYLTHSYDGTYSASASIFVEEKNSSDFEDANTIIYGHHMRSGAMFAGLEAWSDQMYYESHPVMWLVTPEQDYKVVLFSGYTTSAYSDVYTIYRGNGPQLNEYVDGALARSDFQSDFIPDETGKYVVMSTCAYVFDNARYVLHGLLVPVDSAAGVPLE